MASFSARGMMICPPGDPAVRLEVNSIGSIAKVLLSKGIGIF